MDFVLASINVWVLSSKITCVVVLCDYLETFLVCVTIKVCLEQLFHVVKVVVAAALMAHRDRARPPQSHKGVGETRVEESREKRL